jgi:phage recombination protein Bet
VSSNLTPAGGYTDELVGLIRRTVMPRDATNDELALFVEQCRRTGLDPLARQIHATKRGGRLVIQVGIDGFRLIAERTKETDGQDGPFWCGEDGKWVDVWLSKDKPAAAKVTVYRRGQSRGYTGVARWVEFYQPAGGMWDKLPSVMLAKVAESIALRKAFPQELSGLYTSEEMDQAGDDGHAHHATPADPPKQLPAADPDRRPGDARELLAAVRDAGSMDALHKAWAAAYHRKGEFGYSAWGVVERAKDDRKAALSAEPAPDVAADPPAEDRDGLLYELYSACEILKTPAHQMLARHRKQVGAFPDGKPLPKVEELDLPALKHLLALAQQQADAAVEAAEREVVK